MFLSSISLTFADYSGNGHMDWGDGWWVVMAVGMVLFWGLLIFWLVREFGSRRDRGGSTGPDDPLEILDRRLAEGLITPEQYRERTDILAKGRSGPDAP